MPEAPPAPVFIDATSTTVTLYLQPSPDDNGARITNYELWLDAGNNLLSSFTEVESFTNAGFASIFTLD